MARLFMSGCISMVECQLPKLNVAGSIPVTRSTTLRVEAITAELTNKVVFTYRGSK